MAKSHISPINADIQLMLERTIPAQAIREFTEQTKLKYHKHPKRKLNVLEHVVLGGYYVGDMAQDIADGFDVNQRDKAGRTPLMYCIHTHTVYIDILLESGADITLIDNDGNTVLHYLYGGTGKYYLDLFLEKGGDINHKNRYGFTILDYAVVQGFEITPLLGKGARWSPIPQACVDSVLKSEGLWNGAIFQQMIADGLKIDEAFLRSRFIQYSVYDITRLLNRLDLNQISNISLNLMDADEQVQKKILKSLEFFVLYDVPKLKLILLHVRFPFCIQRHSNEYQKLLCNAIKAKNYECLQILLDHFKNPDCGIRFRDSCFKDFLDDEQICAPLLYAMNQQDPESVRILLKAGANATIGYTFMSIDSTAVTDAILKDNIPILQQLIDAGADLNFAIRCCFTPVIVAAKKNRVDILEMLVKNGADPILKDVFGRKPIDFISVEDQPEAYAYLKQFEKER